jgi:hypothetical protein
MKTSLLILFSLVFLEPVESQATTYPAIPRVFYPKSVSTRVYGTDQGNVGDCQSHAEINALENTFSNLGLGLRLSLFHRHAKNYVNLNAPVEMIKQKYTDTDRSLLQATGEFIPEYMWPEDGEGYNSYSTGLRPHPADAIEWDPDFNKQLNFNFERRTWTFHPGFQNSAEWFFILYSVDRNDPTVISIPSALFQNIPGRKPFFNHYTGMMNESYSLDLVKDQIKANGIMRGTSQNFEDGFDHAVAVVGFDSSLYNNQGAIIVRNSWNMDKNSNQFMRTPSDEELVDLKKMRYKISGTNAPGYYAIPYAFLDDLIRYRNRKKDFAYFSSFSLNYQLFFQQYTSLQKRYSILKLPFTCDHSVFDVFRESDYSRSVVDNFEQNHQACRSSRIKSERDLACIEVSNVIDPLTSSFLDIESNQKAFSFAKVSYRKNADSNQVNSFYSGKLADYYCPASNGSKGRLWPYERHTLSEKFKKSITLLSESDDVEDSRKGWINFMLSLNAVNAQSDYD